MAATDQHYRNQKTLNIVFALSSIAMLLSVIWMLVDDYNKPFKAIQRDFRDVEESVNLAMMLESIPPEKDIEDARNAIAEAKKSRDEASQALESRRKELYAERDASDLAYQNIKAEYDAQSSYRDIDAEHVNKLNATTDSKALEAAKKQLQDREKTVETLRIKLAEARDRLDVVNSKIATELTKVLEPYEKAIEKAEMYLKELTGKFDRFAKVAAEKRWKGGDTFRNLPILDGFAAPTRINQIIPEGLTIDYGGFMNVTRFDRCTTCHLGIEKATFDRDTLRLVSRPDVADALSQKLKYARNILKERFKSGETKATLGFDLDDLPKDLKAVKLTDSQIRQFSSHPRLDLFVDSNSPHSAEKFGCTICHAGQGSATDFNLASHSPNNTAQQKRWESGGKEGHHWHSNHYWDFPMQPRRFVESSCLKCHHQVTDLVRFGSQQEAPQLLEGYSLVKDNGCYGCHEISGTKGGRSIGPDLRLEPTPPLEWLPTKDQLTAKADTLSPPGTLRKVGPSLRRTAEKSSADFLASWIRNPRGYRPDTKMPQFYEQPNNRKDVLPESQQKFPDAEIASIVHYLQTESENALKGEDFTRRVVRLDLEAKLEELKKVLEAIRVLSAIATPNAQQKLDLSEQRRFQARIKKDLDGLRRRYRDLSLMSRPMSYKEINALGDQLQGLIDRSSEPGLDANALTTLFVQVKTVMGQMSTASAPAGLLADRELSLGDKKVTEKPYLLDGKNHRIELADIPKVDASKGKNLFTEKGCMACHSHTGATIRTSTGGGDDGPTELSRADFGPELSRIAQKLGPDANVARMWLIQWILNPNVYHPRTKMPITHLKVDEAAGIADWLLSQKDDWKAEAMPKPELVTLRSLALLSLNKVAYVGRQQSDRVLTEGLSKDHLSAMAPDADEQLLVDLDQTGKPKPGSIDEKRLMRYVGKKAISRLGCYACHDIPGFEAAKPIGTALNDWGKKDPERLAFEDAKAFVKGHFEVAELRDDPKNPSQPAESWKKAANGGKKPVIEQFFADAVSHHSRDGFLHLKLAEPRSYDYGRVREWDDRLRMPQFKFSRTHRRDSKTEEIDAYVARRQREAAGNLDAQSQFEEARAREAVMTFVLGLVAEPIPLKFVNNPKPDRLAEVKGLQVLEKYNCTGCHEVRPGVYQFKVPESKKADYFADLEGYFTSKEALWDHVFHDSTAWVGRPSPIPGSSMAFGVSVPDKDTVKSPTPLSARTKSKDGADVYTIRLSEAFRYTNGKGEVRDLPAGTELTIPAEFAVTVAETYGGELARLLGPYLARLNSDKYKTHAIIRASLPPTLIREGERVQPQWLFKFLLDPTVVRPMTVLRMPKFNMSEEDARTLVDYFAAVDKMVNPIAGLNEAFAEVPQQDWSYWVARNQTYLAGRKGFAEFMADMARDAAIAKLKTDKPTATQQEIDKTGKEAREAALSQAQKATTDREAEQRNDLQGVWQRYLRERVAVKQLELDGAEFAITRVPAAEKMLAEKARDDLKVAVEKLKKELADVENKKFDAPEFKAFEQEFGREQVYAANAHRLVTDAKTICVTCHSIGNLAVKDNQGPNLGLAQDRLRPRWAMQWIANPDRLLSYPSHMPQNFKNNDPPNPIFMEALPREYAEGARDVLMNLRVIDRLPVNRFRLAPKGGEYRDSGFGDK